MSGSGSDFAGQSAANSASTLESRIRAAASGQYSGPPLNIAPLSPNRQNTPCADPVADPTHFAGPCNELRENLDRHDTDALLSTIGGVAAGVGVGTIVVGYF